MKKQYLNVALLVITIVLMALPWGYTMVYASGPREYHFSQVAYFSMIAWGNGSFFPGLCAFFTCITFVLAIVDLFVKSGKLDVTVMVFSAIAFVLSIFPLIRNVEYITIISIIMSVLLLINLVITAIPNKQNKKG